MESQRKIRLLRKYRQPDFFHNNFYNSHTLLIQSINESVLFNLRMTHFQAVEIHRDPWSAKNGTSCAKADTRTSVRRGKSGPGETPH